MSRNTKTTVSVVAGLCIVSGVTVRRISEAIPSDRRDLCHGGHTSFADVRGPQPLVDGDHDVTCDCFSGNDSRIPTNALDCIDARSSQRWRRACHRHREVSRLTKRMYSWCVPVITQAAAQMASTPPRLKLASLQTRRTLWKMQGLTLTWSDAYQPTSCWHDDLLTRTANQTLAETRFERLEATADERALVKMRQHTYTT